MDKRIKIVYIISHLNTGGAQILVLDILKHLKQKRDLSISIISIDSGEYINVFKKEGIETIDLGEKGLVNAKIYFKLKKILNSIKPDIVHTHMLKADFYGRIAAKHAGVKVIYSTCHNYSTHHKGADVNKQSVFDIIDNFVISYSNSHLIAISEIVKKYLINRKSNYVKITEVIYNGVDIGKEKYKLNETEVLSFRNDYQILKDDFVITILGRMVKQKGHLFFLNSIKDFLKEKKDIKVLILGDGDLRGEIVNKINEYGLTEIVKIMGFRKETEEIIEISDIICVPSLWEGFGLVITEAMIKNKIVLASDVGGIPEIIEDGKTGFLFEVNNENSFLEKLTYIYENKKDMNVIKKNALQLVKDKFNIQKNSDLYYKSYLQKLNLK